MRFLPLIIAALAFASTGRAQLSPAGYYTGTAPGVGDVFLNVSSRSTATLVYFDYTNRFADIATLSLSGTQATGVSVFGNNVSITVTATAFSGRIAGVTFSGTREPLFGARQFNGLAGSILDTNSTQAVPAFLSLLPSGKAIFFYILPTGLLGGVGTINAANQVVVPTTSGRTFSFNVNPVNRLAFGTISATGISPLTFALIEIRQPTVVNIATRGTVGSGNSLSAGFVINGTKTVLIRGVGPALASFGVAGAQTDPSITLYSGTTALATNDNWSGAEPAAAAAQAGAFALTQGSRDAAMLVTLDAGAYTVQVSGTGPAGDALVEVYEIQ